MKSAQAKYFVYAVFIIGSIGIWLPIIIENWVDKKVTFHNIPPNMTTYFISILFAGSIDYFLNKIDNLKFNLKNAFLDLIGLILLSIALVVCAVVAHVNSNDFIAFTISLFGIFLAWRIWWVANVNNPNFVDAVDSLGGNPNKPLAK